jgi:drug/metabolite transporter (DMT)-like permease
MARLSPLFAIVVACLFWALGTVLSKSLLDSVPPLTVLVLQLAPSVLVLWVLVAAQGVEPTPARKLLPIALLGLLNPGWSYTLNIFGLVETTASVAALLWSAEPVLILVLAWIVLRERVTASLVAAVGLALVGVVFVSGFAVNTAVPLHSHVGAALILAGVLCCAIYTVVARSLAADPLLTVAIQQSVALAWTAAIWPIELSAGAWNAVLALSPSDLLTAMVSGLMYYAAAYWLYLFALRSFPASVAGAFFNLIPLFGIAAAYIFLGERLTPVQWAGGTLILLGVMILLKVQVRSRMGAATPV